MASSKTITTYGHMQSKDEDKCQDHHPDWVSGLVWAMDKVHTRRDSIVLDSTAVKIQKLVWEARMESGVVYVCWIYIGNTISDLH